jgi:hypothetical protein
MQALCERIDGRLLHMRIRQKVTTVVNSQFRKFLGWHPEPSLRDRTAPNLRLEFPRDSNAVSPNRTSCLSGMSQKMCPSNRNPLLAKSSHSRSYGIPTEEIVVTRGSTTGRVPRVNELALQPRHYTRHHGLPDCDPLSPGPSLKCGAPDPRVIQASACHLAGQLVHY